MLAGISDHDLLFSREGEGGGAEARAHAEALVVQDRFIYAGSHNPQAAAAPVRRRAAAASAGPSGAPYTLAIQIQGLKVQP